MSVLLVLWIDRRLKEGWRSLGILIGVWLLGGRKPGSRGKDEARIAWASLKMDELRRSVEGWSGVEEIRRWREGRGR